MFWTVMNACIELQHIVDIIDLGDLTWNGTLYGAYFVVHGASGWTEGHYGDSIVYVNADGSRRPKDKYGNTWGCSHVSPTNSLDLISKLKIPPERRHCNCTLG
jgi:hypothetical protein